MHAKDLGSADGPLLPITARMQMVSDCSSGFHCTSVQLPSRMLWPPDFVQT